MKKALPTKGKSPKKKINTDDSNLKPVSFKFTEHTRGLLKKLSEANRRSMTGTLEHLIIEAARLQSIT